MYYQKIYLPFDGIYPDAGVPFYYPNNDEEQERDKRRIQNMYPEKAKRLELHIMEKCDQLEFEGSFLYDEYPDTLRSRALCREMVQKAKREGEDEEMLMDLCQVMLYHEMYLRRSRRRERRNRRFY